MLIYGETPKQHKKWLMDLIRTNRNFIKTLEEKRHIFPEAEQLLPTLRQEIKDWLAEMVELERWRRKEGYDTQQPYKPPSQVAYEKELIENDELEHYMEYQAELEIELKRLEHKLKMEGINNE